MITDDRKYLPYGRQFIDDDDVQAVVDVLKSDWLTTGPAVRKFEEKFQSIVKSDFVVSCSSGTAALHLAYLALGIGQGDRVIVPSISFVATANAAVYCGADILFADVDPETGLMRATDVLNLINGLSSDELNSVAVICSVNLAGEVSEIEEISVIARKYGWKIIIDSCHAVGSIYQDSKGQARTVGDCYFADMEVFSFHPVKTIAMGEGGVVSTNDNVLYDKLCLLRNHGIEKESDNWVEKSKVREPWYYEMQLLGYNYRQSDLHCALGISQLNKLPKFVEKRRVLVEKYNELLAGLSDHIKPMASAHNCTATRHLYVILVDFEALGITRIDFIDELAKRKIGTQVHYIPINDHPFYIEKYGVMDRLGAEQYYSRTLSLPLHVSMCENDVIYVVDQVISIMQGL